MNKVLISTSTFGKEDETPLKMLQKANLSFSLNPYQKTLTTSQLIELLDGVEYLIAGVEPITEEVFKKHPQLKFISRCGSGIDNVDLNAAKRYDVAVATTPQAPVAAVAELTLGLMLNVLRHIALSDRLIRAGQWQRSWGNLLFEKKVGLIGFGRVGQRVAQLLEPFDVSLLIYDIRRPQLKGAQQNKKKYRFVSLDQLLKTADVVSIHLPLSAQTRNLLNEPKLKLLKPTAVLVNTSRGSIVNEAYLLKMLSTGQLKAAALDVFEQEPYEGPLKKLDNTLLTAHIGSYARESRLEMECEAVRNVLEFIIDDRTTNRSSKTRKRSSQY